MKRMQKQIDRRAALLKRAGIDLVKADPRPTNEILNDYIPYGRWAMEAYLRKQHGKARKNKRKQK